MRTKQCGHDYNLYISMTVFSFSEHNQRLWLKQSFSGVLKTEKNVNYS